jgi:hypothetical protein
MATCEQPSGSPVITQSHYYGLLEASDLDDRGEVLCPLLDQRLRPIADRVRESNTPTIEEQ